MGLFLILLNNLNKTYLSYYLLLRPSIINNDKPDVNELTRNLL